MEHFDFDRVIDRRHTGSLKYDAAPGGGETEGVLPFWIADMDFRSPEPVIEAMQKRVAHGIFGYTGVGPDYYDAVAGWFARRFGWETQREWLVSVPGVVFAISMAVRAFTQPGDPVLVQPPVYGHFFSPVLDNGRRIVESELRYRDGRYDIDFEDFEQKLTESGAKLFILCSPHNPVGRVWTKEELRRLGAICKAHGVTVLSDEIHCDFAFPGHPHTVFLQACPEMAEQTVVCTAPSKSFNLAGLNTSNIWIPSEELRSRFLKEVGATGVTFFNSLGPVACMAAYNEGEAWLDACCAYMRENLAALRSFLAERLPQVRLVEPEGTYFAWLDCSGLGLSPEELEDLLVNRARIRFGAGEGYGSCGKDFQRVVLACPRTTLTEALERWAQAVEKV